MSTEKEPDFKGNAERLAKGAVFARSLAHPPAREIVEAGNAMYEAAANPRFMHDGRTAMAHACERWRIVLAQPQPQPKEVAPTVDQIVEVRDSILRLMGYGVDMPTVEEIIIDLAKPTRP